MMRRTLFSRIGGILLPVVLGLCAQIPAQQFVSADPSVRQAALKRLAALPAEEKRGYIPELVRLLHGKNGQLAILAFAKVGPVASPALSSLLDDPDRLVRGFATEALATLRPITTEAFKNVRRMMKDKDQFVRQRAAASFLSFGIDDPEAAAIVAELWPKQPAVSARKGIGESAVPALLKSLKDEDPHVRADAADALYGLHLFWPEIQKAFLRALHDPYPRVRQQARLFLTFQVTATAMDAILQDDIAQAVRKKETERLDRLDKPRPHSRDEILAPVPADPDHYYPLKVANQFEVKAPDGTALSVVLHKGEERGDLLRIWAFRHGSYFLAKEYTDAETTVHSTAQAFRYRAKSYLHVMRLCDCTGYEHEDDFFRIEAGRLVKLRAPEGLPLVLAPGEGVWKGLWETFKDDKLEFSFGIWKEHDANCCPSAGLVNGTYTIVGDELRYATWKRSNGN